MVGLVSAGRWDRYVGRFHDDRAGITEAVLSRAVDDCGETPYGWVTAGLSAGVVADVGCGSGPTRGGVGRWVGIDRSRAELDVARRRGRGPLLVGSAAALPVRTRAADAAIAVMSLMVVGDPRAALGELVRVLRPGGELRVLVPATGPLTAGDRLRYGLLLAALGRREVPFPRSDVTRDPAALLATAGFSVVADEHRRFRCRIGGPPDADLLLDSLYLPGVGDRRLALARRLVRWWGRGELGLPLRLVTARSGR